MTASKSASKGASSKLISIYCVLLILERKSLVVKIAACFIFDGILNEFGGGSFTVYTDDDNPPNLEEGVDIYDCGYETELIECFDGCWEDHNMDDCDEDVREWLEEFLEENSVFDLEEHGWICGDTQMLITCEMEITKDE